MRKTYHFFIGPQRMWRQEFEGDSTFEFGVLSFVKDAQAAFVELFEDLELGYGFTDHNFSSKIIQKKTSP